MNNIVYLVPAFGIVGLLYTAWRFSWVSKQPTGDENMQRLSGYIADGAIAFLKAEWKILSYFAIPTAILLAWLGSRHGTPENPIHSSPIIAIAFLIGALFSATAGYIGMKIATKANVRTAQAARTSLAKALEVSFTGGSVMGMGVAGLAVLGLGGLFITFYNLFAQGQALTSDEMRKAIEVLAGFSLGAESIALFARVGGGIYTKAADVGADLVGKVEAGIPEDDVRNPATIADNVGDNVGDVAGMGADLFGSYVATILATMVLGQEINVSDNYGGFSPVLLPMLIAGVGLLASLVSTFFVRISSETASVQSALNLGNWASIIITFIASYFLVKNILPEQLNLRGFEFTSTGVFLAIIVGLVVGALMSMITEYYTAMGKRPVLSIIEKSGTGHATNIIGGLAVGMESTVLPILVLAAGIILSYKFAGLYGVSIAAAGMMATTAMQLAIDAFGPIADNAGGIAEMSQLPPEVRERTDNLDAVGNTTAATGKGFAIASAALTSLALFAAFVGIAGIKAIDIYKADVLAGLFIGGMIPFIFSALCISAVGKAAMEMVNEVRRQFREIPGIMEYKAQPEYEKCVAISTQASIRQMILPGAIALTVPVIVGFTMGPEVLGGVLAGVTVSGVLMGMFQSNAGGAWDNAKKSFEKGVVIDGETYYKKSEPHKASVTGDTVGDPFKDTSGPSMNILIKLMSIVSLVIAPYITVQSGSMENTKLEELSPKAVTELPVSDKIKDLGALFSKKLSSGVDLNIPENGIENNLLKFIEDASKPVDKTTWFDFDRLTFETGKSVLKPESQEQLKNIAEILKAFPKVSIKLGGYTDNTGDAKENLMLSNERAASVKSELEKLGVSAQRLESEGYGQEHPVADNTTEEGRALNRRISIRVLSK
ncbi:K(+)-stimulated pyrophosphate-energized sodium pump [Pseudarcicella hirudinis]|uniref:Putative K(+)-stimulated pyrophosphate-energized sodium pump n=1 Tax=Pseudarcicella hirudinis TaxID=1079859 RepID=A0A1I5US54_9BACT|nr:sodium-translocating pyrophosphatase [Pseudarcicella hirudinis]SFP98134.1 K(+)-stimulated pyrophosphate-energized sodium pump [Pseudarcicella hirudinis]